MHFSVFIIFCSILLSFTSQPAVGESPQILMKSCRDFVSKFYNRAWTTDDAKPSPYGLSPQLFNLLNADYTASMKSKGDIVGLDFDPILATNAGPAERYVLGKSSTKNNHYFVEVFGILNGKMEKRPTVIPELIRKDGKWLFVNFCYPKDGDIPASNLVSLLNQYANERYKMRNSASHIHNKK